MTLKFAEGIKRNQKKGTGEGIVAGNSCTPSAKPVSFSFMGDIMAKQKKAKYYLQTTDGQKALVYAIFGYNVKTTAARRFLIDVTRGK